MQKTTAIIQARIGSERLPSKVLLDLSGKTVLEHVVQRVRNSKLIQDVVVATTTKKEDLKIADLCLKKSIKVYRGSDEDVLDRYYKIAKTISAEHIVRVTADCPLIDPKIIDDVIRLHLLQKADYTSNVIDERFPDGEDVEIFTFETLHRAWENANLSSEREHVTPYIIKHPEIFKLKNLSCSQDLSKKRWTLDEEKDYKFIKLIYDNLYRNGRIFGMSEILNLLKQHPKYEKINSDVARNIGYLKSLKEDKFLNLKHN